MKLRVFLADDDAGMRMMLRRIIESMEDFDIVGEACDGLQAVSQCKELKPDILMIDVEMPVMTGTEAAREIAALLPEISIIFVTAHSEYMPEAFEVYAADYLIKPFRTDRVRQTLRKLQSGRQKTPASAIMLKSKEGISIVQVADVIMVYREGRSSYVITADEEYLTGKSLNELWPSFADRGFMRSHRSYIVNISQVAKIYPYGRWTYQLKLKGTDKDALITHDMLEELQSFLES